MATVYVYVMNTMADWEVSYAMAELHSRRFFRKDAGQVEVKTVSHDGKAVCTMGGLKVFPDCSVDDLEIAGDNMLILPGSDEWSNPIHKVVLETAQQFLEVGGAVAAICGATLALANLGILNDRKHTSNGAGFLGMFCPEYKGETNYIDKPAVRDRNLITAGSTGGLLFAKLILEYFEVFYPETLENWHKYFSTGDADAFFRMMESIQ